MGNTNPDTRISFAPLLHSSPFFCRVRSLRAGYSLSGLRLPACPTPWRQRHPARPCSRRNHAGDWSRAKRRGKRRWRKRFGRPCWTTTGLSRPPRTSSLLSKVIPSACYEYSGYGFPWHRRLTSVAVCGVMPVATKVPVLLVGWRAPVLYRDHYCCRLQGFSSIRTVFVCSFCC